LRGRPHRSSTPECDLGAAKEGDASATNLCQVGERWRVGLAGAFCSKLNVAFNLVKEVMCAFGHKPTYAKLCDELLNGEALHGLTEARVLMKHRLLEYI